MLGFLEILRAEQYLESHGVSIIGSVRDDPFVGISVEVLFLTRGEFVSLLPKADCVSLRLIVRRRRH